jgi:hypothetical protein
LIEIQPTPGTSLTHDGGYVLGGNGKRFDIRIHALKMQTPTPDPEWSNAIENQARMVGNTPDNVEGALRLVEGVLGTKLDYGL